MESKRVELDPLGGMRPAKQRSASFPADFCKDADSPMDWRRLGRRVLSEAARLARESAGIVASVRKDEARDATREGHEAIADLADAAADTTSSVSPFESNADAEDLG